MLSTNCPACGAQLQFKSKLTVSLSCGYCSALIVRDSNDIRNAGKIGALLEDTSPLQLYSTGQSQLGQFQTIGRCQWSFDDGFWNEWFINFSTGKSGWLAEAQGQYVVCVEDSSTKLLPSLKNLRVGQNLKIGKDDFSIDDIKKATLAAFEGELPFSPRKGDSKTIVDLSREDSYACIEFSADGVSCSRGSVFEFDELNFKNLRRSHDQ